MAVEPLAEAILECPDIVGFRRCRGEEKIALFADDALVFLGDTYTSVSSVISLIDTYGTFSGFKITWDKSVIMPIDPIDPIQLELPHQDHQMKYISSFRYLGVIITPNVNEYIDKNILPLVGTFRQ